VPRVREWTYVGIFASLCLALLIVSRDYPFIAVIYPRLLLCLGLVLCCLRVIQLLRKRGRAAEEPIEFGGQERYTWVYLAGGILYIAVTPLLGFLFTTLLVMGLLLFLLGENIRTIVAVTVLTSFGFYAIFGIVLGLQLPQGVLERLLP